MNSSQNLQREPEVRQVDDRSSWNRYLENHPDANFYQRHEWKEINSKNFGHDCHFLGVYQGEHLTGIFPMVFINSLMMGKIMSSMPFVNFGGLCADNDGVCEQLLGTAKSICQQRDADYLEVRSLKPISQSLQTATNKVSLTIELPEDPDQLWHAYKSKHRTNIRRVYKEGVHVRQGHLDLLDDFYQLLVQNWKFLGTPIYRKSYFHDIVSSFGKDIRIYVAYQGDLPVATAFNGHFRGTVEGMWAATLPETRKLMPNYVLYWEMIKDACQSGYRKFHLGRSTAASGAELFKKKWNAESEQIYYQYYLNTRTTLPELNKDNPKYRMAIKAWTMLPLAVTKTLGPIISRNIP